MSLNFTIRKDATTGHQSATIIFSDNSIETVTSENANWNEIVNQLLTKTDFTEAEEERLLGLIKPITEISGKLTQLSERVSIADTTILFDGDPIHGSLVNHILRIVKEGGDQRSYGALVKFLEKLYQNPSEKSRNSLYDFILHYDITIDTDGDFYVYKGVASDGTSIHSGPGIVDGQRMNGHLPNKIGSVIEFPRSEVNADTRIGCATGLHAGTYSYAHRFSQGQLLTVKVNPRDVVSVPDDCGFQKIRVCRYKVTGIADVEMDSTTYDGDESDDDNDWLTSDDDSWEDDENLDNEESEDDDSREDESEDTTPTSRFDDFINDLKGIDLKKLNYPKPDVSALPKDIREKLSSLGLGGNEVQAGLESVGKTLVEQVKNALKELSNGTENTLNEAESEPTENVDSTTSVRAALNRSVSNVRSNGGTIKLSFDYEKVDGSHTKVTDLTLLIDDGTGHIGDLINGILADGQFRRYRVDNISNLAIWTTPED